jgi:hypothetical protein
MTEIEINDVWVYSDKTMTDIEGTRVNFTDGSWCDVETKEVVNKGGGYINIGNPPKENSPNEILTKTFLPLPVLLIEEIAADVEVTVGEATEIKVTITGPKDMLEKLDIFDANSGVAIINKKIIKGPIRNVSAIENSPSIMKGCFCISDSSISIKSNQNNVQISAQVPVNTTVAINQVMGTIKVGDILGDLTISSEDDNRISIGKVNGCHLQISGDTDITIAKLNDYLNANISGDGALVVKEGNIDKIDLTLSGDGDVFFKGAANFCEIKNSSDADITIKEINGELKIGNAGDGDILIKKAIITMLEIRNAGDGDVDIQGEVNFAHLNNLGDGDIMIDRVHNIEARNNLGDGKIRI